MCSWLWVLDMFRAFVFRIHGCFAALSRPLYTTAVYVICCTAGVHGGWVDRFVDVTLLYYVLLYCRQSVGSSLRCCGVFLLSCVHRFVGYFFLFSFVPRYTGPALA